GRAHSAGVQPAERAGVLGGGGRALAPRHARRRPNRGRLAGVRGSRRSAARRLHGSHHSHGAGCDSGRPHSQRSVYCQRVLSPSATPAGLTPGAYRGSITAGSLTIGVTMTVSAVPRTILLSQTGLTFTAAAGGGAPLSQAFGVLNTGQCGMDWTAKAEATTG